MRQQCRALIGTREALTLHGGLSVTAPGAAAEDVNAVCKTRGKLIAQGKKKKLKEDLILHYLILLTSLIIIALKKSFKWKRDKNTTNTKIEVHTHTHTHTHTPIQ